MVHGRLVDAKGKRFGRLTAVERADKDRFGKVRWHCICDCGNKSVVAGTYLHRGEIRSCGCLIKDMAKERKTHGMTGTKEFKIWLSINKRCHNPKEISYPTYGGRGIIVCDRWRKDFAAFYADMGPIPSEKHTIDRINPFWHYEPGNCRWATQKEQQNNKRKHHEIKSEYVYGG